MVKPAHEFIEEIKKLRKHEDEMVYARTNIFFIVHSILIIAVVLSGGSALKHAVVYLGIFLGIFWLFIGVKKLSLMNFYSEKIDELESSSITQIYKEIKDFKDRDYAYNMTLHHYGFRVINIMCVWIPLAFLLCWISSFLNINHLL